MNVMLFIDWRELVGHRVILCANWAKPFHNYLVMDDTQVFLFDGGYWERMAPAERLGDGDMQEQLKRARPQNLLRHASLVVSGTIVATSDSVVVDHSRTRGRIRRATVEISTVSKGSFSGRTLQFSANHWSTRVPRIRVGEQWMAMLERKGTEYWLVGGGNGLLRVSENGELLYDGIAPVGLSKAELERVAKEK